MLARAKGNALLSRKFGNVGTLLVGWRGVWRGICGSQERGKKIYKENTEQKMAAWVKKMWDLYKNQHLSVVCPQNGIFGMRCYKASFQNLNRRANARKKTRENGILVTGCIYK